MYAEDDGGPPFISDGELNGPPMFNGELIDIATEDDGGPPLIPDGEQDSLPMFNDMDLPTVMADTACAALGAIDQAVEADNCLAAHLAPVTAFLILLMSCPFSEQSAGDNLELQAGGSVRLIEELLQRLHLVDARRGSSVDRPLQEAGPAALQRLHHLLLDLAVLASSRFIDQLHFRSKGVPAVLRNRWLAMFPPTYLTDGLVSRLGNAKAHVFTCGVLNLAKKRRARFRYPKELPTSQRSSSSAAAQPFGSWLLFFHGLCHTSTSSAEQSLVSAVMTLTADPLPIAGDDGQVVWQNESWAGHAVESWWAADWWTDAAAPADPAADESFFHSWAEHAAEERAAAPADPPAEDSLTDAAAPADPAAAPADPEPATSVDALEFFYHPEFTLQIWAIVQDGFYLEFPLSV